MAHIFFLTHWYPSPLRPVQGIFIAEHARAIAQNHSVSVAHIQGLRSQSESPAAYSHDPEFPIDLYHITYPNPSLPKTAWLARLRQTDKLFRDLLRKPEPPSLIHANVYSSADLAIFLSKKYHLPAVLSEHASAFPRQLFTQTQVLKLRTLLNRMVCVMPVCKTLEVAMRRYGIKAPFEIVPNVVDTELFTLPPLPASGVNPTPIHPDKRILCVAGLTPIKSLDTLINALPLVQQQVSNIQLILIGDGPEKSNLQALARSLNVSQNIQFLGYQPKTTIAGWMRQSDCFVLCSLWENQPVALLEAQACGLPVVATNTGGIHELVKPDNGLLVETQDPQGLARAIVQVLSTPSVYSPTDIRKPILAKHSYAAVAEKFEHCYRLAQSKSP